ncbi:MAG: tetratricopeptide repeat protein [Chromatiaceae bacterium]|nr:MAG: tetratricopeptide repeat protein [Chromatiaceae bacterium]
MPALPLILARSLAGTLALLVLLCLPTLATASNDIEKRIYEQSYQDVKATFDDVKYRVDYVATQMERFQQAIDGWRRATTREAQDNNIQGVEDLLQDLNQDAIDKLLALGLGEEGFKALSQFQDTLGFRISDQVDLLSWFRGNRSEAFGHMYRLSELERTYRSSDAVRHLRTAKAHLDRGEAHLKTAGGMVEFVKLFDPTSSNPEVPTESLRRIRNVLTSMEKFTDKVPALNAMINFYVEATDAFIDALTRLDAQIVQARQGALCGQMGKDRAVQRAFEASCGSNCNCSAFLAEDDQYPGLSPIRVWQGVEDNSHFIYLDERMHALVDGGSFAILYAYYQALQGSTEERHRTLVTPERLVSITMAMTRPITQQHQTFSRHFEIVDGPDSDEFQRVLERTGKTDSQRLIAEDGTSYLLRSGRREEFAALNFFSQPFRSLISRLVEEHQHQIVIPGQVTSTAHDVPLADVVVRINGQTQPLECTQSGCRFSAIVARRTPFTLHATAKDHKSFERDSVEAYGTLTALPIRLEPNRPPEDSPQPASQPGPQPASPPSPSPTASGDAMAPSATAPATPGLPSAPGRSSSGTAPARPTILTASLQGLQGHVLYGSQATLSVNVPDSPPPEPVECVEPGPGSPFAVADESGNPFRYCADIRIEGIGAGTRPSRPTDPQSASYRYVWHGSPDLRFDQPTTENPRTTVTYTRMGRVLVWVQVLAREGNTWRLHAESQPVAVDVAAPEFALQFSRPDGEARIGDTVHARVVSRPAVADALVDHRWMEPAAGHRQEYGTHAAEIAFVIQDEKPIALEVHARVPHHGDTLATVRGSYTGGDYRVSISEPRRPGPPARVWDAAQGGLVMAPAGAVVTHEEVYLSAGVAPRTTQQLRYRWQVNPSGARLFSPGGRDTRFSAHAPGTYAIELSVHDTQGRILGSARRTLSVLPDGMPADDAERAGQIQAHLDSMRDHARAGRLHSALQAVRDALAIDPDHSEAQQQLQRLAYLQDAVDRDLAEASRLLETRHEDDARAIVQRLQRAYPEYPPVLELNHRLEHRP